MNKKKYRQCHNTYQKILRWCQIVGWFTLTAAPTWATTPETQPLSPNFGAFFEENCAEVSFTIQFVYFVPPNPSTANPSLSMYQKFSPARGIVVNFLDSYGNPYLLGKHITDGQGQYKIWLPKNSSVTLQIEARLENLSWKVAVHDSNASPETARPATYSLQHTFKVGNEAVHHPVVIDHQKAMPFFILDTLYSAMTQIVSCNPNHHFPPLAIFLDENVPASADSHWASLFLNQSRPNAMTEFLRHWCRHFVINTDPIDFSNTDTLLLDPRIAFEEGLVYGMASAFGGNTQYLGYYPSVKGRALIDFSNPSQIYPIWSHPSLTAYLVFSMLRRVGLGPVYSAVIDLVDDPAFITVFSFANALRKRLQSENQLYLDHLLTRLNIVNGDQLDRYGTHQSTPNIISKHPSYFLPIYTELPLDLPSTVCTTSLLGTSEHLEVFGHRRYLSFNIQTPGKHMIYIEKLSNPSNLPELPYTLKIHDMKHTSKNGSSKMHTFSETQSASPSFNFEAGEHVGEITDDTFRYPTIERERCFQLTLTQ